MPPVLGRKQNKTQQQQKTEHLWTFPINKRTAGRGIPNGKILEEACDVRFVRSTRTHCQQADQLQPQVPVMTTRLSPRTLPYRPPISCAVQSPITPPSRPHSVLCREDDNRYIARSGLHAAVRRSLVLLIQTAVCDWEHTHDSDAGKSQESRILTAIANCVLCAGS